MVSHAQSVVLLHKNLLHFSTNTSCLFQSAADVDFNGTSPIHATFYNGSVAGDRFYIHIPIFDDHVVEDYEYFNVSLSGSDLEIHIETAIVKIIDDDCK